MQLTFEWSMRPNGSKLGGNIGAFERKIDKIYCLFVENEQDMKVISSSISWPPPLPQCCWLLSQEWFSCYVHVVQSLSSICLLAFVLGATPNYVPLKIHVYDQDEPNQPCLLQPIWNYSWVLPFPWSEVDYKVHERRRQVMGLKCIDFRVMCTFSHIGMNLWVWTLLESFFEK